MKNFTFIPAKNDNKVRLSASYMALGFSIFEMRFTRRA